ncbi:MAG: bifunctional 2-polyprenyl-6-hydroxyphenol methylase/3-demethylubiquinol 3-O-methyltransferase UbiG [Gammaproteobacteria bacterium]
MLVQALQGVISDHRAMLSVQPRGATRAWTPAHRVLQNSGPEFANVPSMNSTPEHAKSASVDQREVAYYANLASTWWDPTGPFWPLHRLNVLRTSWLRDQIMAHFDLQAGDAPLAGLRVLDVGCGGGILSESMAALGADVHGIDVVEKNIAIASAHESTFAVNYTCTTAEAMAAAAQRYDVVLNMEVVEHVSDIDGFMAACCALVRPGGLMFLATLNRTPKSWLFGIIGAEYVMRWLPRGTHRWQLFRTPDEMTTLLAKGNFAIVSRTGVNVNPLTRKFSLQPSLQVNYMLCAAKPDEKN